MMSVDILIAIQWSSYNVLQEIRWIVGFSMPS